MAQEIERKFLVKGTSYLSMATKTIHIRQGYISRNIDATVRIRITDNEAFVTIKSRNHGASRHEWEYPIPVADAQEMLHECCDGKVLEKTRYIVPSTELTKGSPLQKSSFQMKTPVSAYPRLQRSK